MQIILDHLPLHIQPDDIQQLVGQFLTVESIEILRNGDCQNIAARVEIKESNRLLVDLVSRKLDHHFWYGQTIMAHTPLFQ